MTDETRRTVTTLPDVHDMVAELTRTHTHRERWTERRGATTWSGTHTSLVPSLIHQLEHAGQPSTGEAGAGGFASRPAAALESLDTLIHIDREAARWVRDLGEDDLHTDTAATIAQLHGLLPSATAPARREIEADVRRWYTQARIVTGWDSPAWRPHNTCPVCGKRGTLRVRAQPQGGLCVECRATWDETTVGVLAEHIRAENDEADTPDGPVPLANDSVVVHTERAG